MSSKNNTYAILGKALSRPALFKPRKEISQEGMEKYVRNEMQKLPEEMKVKIYQPRCQICMEMHPVCYH